MRGLSLAVASKGHSSSRCAGLSLSWPLLLRSTGFRRAGSVVVAHGPSRSAACGIFPDQSSNSCPLHWQADSQPLHHQGSPKCFLMRLIVEKRAGNRLGNRESQGHQKHQGQAIRAPICCSTFISCSLTRGCAGIPPVTGSSLPL